MLKHKAFRSTALVMAILMAYMGYPEGFWIASAHASGAARKSGGEAASFVGGMSPLMAPDGTFLNPDGTPMKADPEDAFPSGTRGGSTKPPWADLENTYGDDAEIQNKATTKRDASIDGTGKSQEQEIWADLYETTKRSPADLSNDAALQTSWETLGAMDSRVPSCVGSTGKGTKVDKTCNKPMPKQYESCTANRQWSTSSFTRTVEAEWRFIRDGFRGRTANYVVSIPELGQSGTYHGHVGKLIDSSGDRANSKKAIRRGILAEIKKGLEEESKASGKPVGEVTAVVTIKTSELGWPGYFYNPFTGDEHYPPGAFKTFKKEVDIVGIILETDDWRTANCLNKMAEFKAGKSAGYAFGDLTCEEKLPTDSSGCALFGSLPVCPGERPLPSQIDHMPFNCESVSLDGHYDGAAMPGFGSKSCKILEKDKTCSFEKAGECKDYYPDGTCAYYENKYTCGYNTDTDNCDVQKDVIDLFPECETNYSTTSTTDSYLLSDPQSCEIIKPLGSCNVKRNLSLSSGSITGSSISETPSEPENSPCLKADDGHTKVTWTCNSSMSPTQEANILSGAVLDPLYPGDDGTCLEATASYDTHFYKAEPGPWDLNTCDNKEADGCTVLSAPKCVNKGKSPENGYCYLEEMMYECGNEVDMTSTDIESQYDCGTELSCLGNDCLDTAGESGKQDFAQAVAATQVMEAVTGSAQCDPKNPGSCTIFEGEFMWCKKALGGTKDCCDGPSGPSLASYITLLRAGRKTLEGMQNIDAFNSVTQPVTGSWNYIKSGAKAHYNSVKEPVMKTWDKISSRMFTSAPENVQAVTSGAKSGIGVAGETSVEGASKAANEGFLAGVKQDVANKSAEFLADNFGEGARDAFFTAKKEAGEDAASDAAANFELGGKGAYLGQALNFLMTAYMVYVVAMLVIEVVFACKEIEFKLSGKKDLRVCHRLGSWCERDAGIGCVEKREGYCCFSSPLGRIMNEQVRGQLSMPWGGPESPNCSGISIKDLNKIDWNKVDLTEWIAILSSTGNMPSPNVSDMMDQYSSDAISGSDSTIANEAARDNVEERTMKRLEDTSTSEIEKNMSEGLWQSMEKYDD